MQVIITTVENGRNRGRLYVHVLEEDEAQDWMSNLQTAVSAAKQRARAQRMEEIYGHSRFSMLRAQTRQFHQSNAFSVAMAFFIVLGFLLDIAEAQVRPREGSTEESTFILLDLIITAIFAAELLINLFANSDDGFRPFYTRAANWFDAGIVLGSVVNVVLAQVGGVDANAKLLRLLRIGRVIRLFSALKDLQKILSACSSAVRRSSKP